jgi:hypothetical protein
MSLPDDDLFSGWSETSPSPSTGFRSCHFESPFRGERSLPDGAIDFGDSEPPAKAVYSFTPLPPAVHQIAGMYAPLQIANLPHRFAFGFPAQAPVAPSLPPSALDERFMDVLADPSETINPKQLGFIPVSAWLNHDMTFGQLVESFFQRKNCAQGRFCHKLFNALRLATAAPHLVRYIGVD